MTVEISAGVQIDNKNSLGVPIVLVGYNEIVRMHRIVLFAGFDVVVVDVSECATRKVWLGRENASLSCHVASVQVIEKALLGILIEGNQGVYCKVAMLGIDWSGAVIWRVER